MEDAVERLQREVMTVAAITACLLPLMRCTGTVSEVRCRTTAPLVGITI